MHTCGPAFYKSRNLDIPAFFAGAGGGFYDLTNGAYLFTDSSRTVPASLNGTIGGVTDLSGNGNHLSGSATRKAGYADFNGTTNELDKANPATSLGSSTGWSAFIGIMTDSTAAPGGGYSLIDSDYASPHGSPPIVDGRMAQQLLQYPVNLNTVYFNQAQGVDTKSTSITWGTSTKNLVGAILSTTGLKQRQNKAQLASYSNTLSLQAWNNTIVIGAGFAGTFGVFSRFFKGRIYCACLINRPLSAPDIAILESYMGSLLGI